MKILMVCLGNICRSPLAEGILKDKVAKLELSWEIDSAGTSSYHKGALPDRRSIAVAAAHGLDIKSQRSRPFVYQDFLDFDHIFVMDSSNFQDVLAQTRTPKDREKIKLIMNMTEPKLNQAVPDPYWGENGFEEVYQMLDQACSAIVKKIKK